MSIFIILESEKNIRSMTDRWAKRAKWRAWRVLPTTWRTEVSKSRKPSETTCLIGLSSEKEEWAAAPATMAMMSVSKSDEVCCLRAIRVSSDSLSNQLSARVSLSRKMVKFWWALEMRLDWVIWKILYGSSGLMWATLMHRFFFNARMY